MKIKITTTLFVCDKTVQIVDTSNPVIHLRTPLHPRKGADFITELFVQAIQDAKDTNLFGHITFEEVLHCYDVALKYYEEQKQYAKDFRF